MLRLFFEKKCKDLLNYVSEKCDVCFEYTFLHLFDFREGVELGNIYIYIYMTEDFSRHLRSLDVLRL